MLGAKAVDRALGLTVAGETVAREEVPMNSLGIALCVTSQKSTMPIRDWKAVPKRFRIDSEKRISAP